MDNYNFPKELTALRQWVCWRVEKDNKSGRDTKVPYSPKSGYRASASNPDTWGTLGEAIYHKDKYMFSGIGFVFTTECGIIGIDIDHCLADGQPNEVALAILERLPPTYIEISPSRKGLHIFLKGKLPKGGNKNSESGVEMYSSRRYFTMTGNRWKDYADEIAADNGSINCIFDTFIKSKPPPKKNKTNDNQGYSTLSDETLLATVKASKDGAVFDKLWRGEWQDKYKSQSEADFALCCKLAFWANHDLAQMDRLFRQSGLFREKWDVRHSGRGETYGETTIRRACENTPETYRPKKKRSIGIFEQDGAYYSKRGENVKQLTNFIIKPIEMVRSDEEAQLTADFITDDGETYRLTLLAGDFANVQRFKKTLNTNMIALCFFGTDGELEVLKQYINMLSWKVKKSVKAMGIYNHNKQLVFVTTSSAVSAGGKAVNSIIQAEKYKFIDSDILTKPFMTAGQLENLGSLILSYNEPAKTIPILGWCARCFIKPHLKRRESRYPHLFLIGESGSGKSSTLEYVIMRLFSRRKVIASSTVTQFVLMNDSNSSNVIPQAFDEFKPSTIEKKPRNVLYNHLRDSYDMHEGFRGKADQTVKTYDLLAPIVVAGEESADETAIRERTIELLFTKKDMFVEDYVIAFKALNFDILGAFGRTLLDVALRTTPDEAAAWYEEGAAKVKERFPSRVISNIACVYAGLKLVEKLCKAFNLSWDYVFPHSLDACTDYTTYAVREYLLDGSIHNISVVEQTFEVMARMGLKAGKDFTFECAGRHLCIALYDVYDRFTAYHWNYRVMTERLKYRDFCKQLKHSQYIAEKSRQMKLGGKSNRRFWVIDFEKLQQVCDVSGFLTTDVEEE